MKNMLKRTFALVLGFVLFIPFTAMAAEVSDQEAGSFTKLLAEYNITVAGSNIEMTEYQFSGLTNMLDTNNSIIAAKFKKQISPSADNIKLTPKEFLEINYYSKTPEQQKEFLSKVSNQKVDISSKDGVVLISYNANVLSTNATTKYTSSRVGEIRMQDSVTGDWGSATIKLTGYFTKTTSGSKWTIIQEEDDYDVDEDAYSPVGILSNTVYSGSSYTSTGTYKGNEINCQSYAQVVCGFNDSSLSIYVYPNSSYNYATIGD